MNKAIGAMLASWLAIGTAVAADAPKAASRAPTAADWAALAKLPDWSGIWEHDWRGQHRPARTRTPMKLTPEYQKKLDAYRAAQKDGENLQSQGANCVPPGLPGIMTQPYPIEFLYNPGKIVMVIETYMQFRHIYTDGRKHPEDPDPAYMGHSIGHWEGDTLVVDSVGFNPTTMLAPGVPHSDQLRIVERIRRVDAKWMEIETTLIDPVVLAEPYTSTASYGHLDDEIREFVCLENNRDSADEKGRPGFSLERK